MSKKKPSPWVMYVKNFAKKHKISYGCALCDPVCKEQYRLSKLPPILQPDYRRDPTMAELRQKNADIIAIIESVKDHRNNKRTRNNKFRHLDFNAEMDARDIVKGRQKQHERYKQNPEAFIKRYGIEFETVFRRLLAERNIQY